MHDFFKELFEYSHRMNQKFMAEMMKQPGNISEKSRLLMSHVLNAQNVWNSRIDEITPAYGIWQLHEPHDWAVIDKANAQKTLGILDRVDLNKTITYKTSKGQPFESTVRDILFHVVNHSTHHRAQVVSDMKQNGFEPIVSDYIFYKR